MNNYYSKELNKKMNETQGFEFFQAENILTLLFKESNNYIKNNLLENYKGYFPSKKIHRNWEANTLFGANHMLSGGISLTKTLLWNSSYNFFNRADKVTNQTVTTFVIDLNGDIHCLVDLTNVNRDKNPVTNTVGITYVNVGLLKKRDDDYYWHSGKKKWSLKYPYKKALPPVRVPSSDYFYQPISQEQVNSSIIINKVLIAFFIGVFRPFVGDMYFSKMIDVQKYIDSVLGSENKLSGTLPVFNNSLMDGINE